MAYRIVILNGERRGERLEVDSAPREIRESPLKHGDVIEVGTTRYLVQEVTENPGWNALAGIRRKKLWLTAGIPLLLVAGLMPVMKQCRKKPPPPPPPPVVQAPVRSPSYPDDSIVTNIPRIRIDPSVTLTTRPPEIAEAVAELSLIDTNPIIEAVNTARQELELGTRFLKEKSTEPDTAPPGTNRESAAVDLTQAEAILQETAAPVVTPSQNPAPQP